MKAYMKKLTVLMAALLFLLSLAACKKVEKTIVTTEERSSIALERESSAPAESDPENDPESEAEETESAEEAESEASEKPVEVVEDGRYATMSDFARSDEMQEQMAAMDTAGMDVSVSGEGNKLTYTFAYQDTDNQDLVTLSKALLSVLESDAMKDTFGSIAVSLKELVAVEDPVVEVVYLAEDGAELAAREYRAEE